MEAELFVGNHVRPRGRCGVGAVEDDDVLAALDVEPTDPIEVQQILGAVEGLDGDRRQLSDGFRAASDRVKARRQSRAALGRRGPLAGQ